MPAKSSPNTIGRRNLKNNSAISLAAKSKIPTTIIVSINCASDTPDSLI